jgi:hypothetical protein
LVVGKLQRLATIKPNPPAPTHWRGSATMPTGVGRAESAVKKAATASAADSLVSPTRPKPTSAACAQHPAASGIRLIGAAAANLLCDVNAHAVCPEQSSANRVALAVYMAAGRHARNAVSVTYDARAHFCSSLVQLR